MSTQECKVCGRKFIGLTEKQALGFLALHQNKHQKATTK